MRFTDASGWSGTYRIRILPSGEEYTVKNRLTDAALNTMRDALYGDAVDLRVTHVAVGDNAAAISDSDSRLGNETFRAAITTRVKPSTGVLECTALLLDSDGAMTIRELGIFADGTGMKDSGLLVSRVLWSRDKTALETIQISRTDTLRRA